MTGADTVIIGAGITGSIAAQELQHRGLDYILLEQNVQPGGLTRSIHAGDAHFDYTGHFLHLQHYASPEAIPYANLNDEDWQRVERRSGILLGESVVPAPFQYNLSALPDHEKEQCWNDFVGRPQNDNPENFSDYLLSGFGKRMCDLFLHPYNEKITASRLSDISLSSIKRFFPPPLEASIRQGYEGKSAQKTSQYNSDFWYPRRQGIGLLASSLASGLTSLRTRQKVQHVSTNEYVIRTDRLDIGWKQLISTMPLKALTEIIDHPDIRQLGKELKHTRVLCLNIQFDGRLPEQFDGFHWLYIPDREIPLYRVGIYSNLPESFVPPGQTALYLEMAFHSDETPPAQDDLIRSVLVQLEQWNFLKRDKLRVISANWIDHAYVLFDHHRDPRVREILDRLQHLDIISAGRYGLWDYISMEDSLLSGLDAAERVSR